ncbi:MAG: 4-hydroxythreonine-4-phosphate dehydrogenase [Helicobacteraceae bacterium]|jgi:4-hydroxythreonine-4-phosphate dehydrogenase|nr:4-hydroxythreonine-4-phosphate dehydrogenase [Helicobacteraceae bacterium]
MSVSPALKKIAISIGDLNGIGFEIALKAHQIARSRCEPIYCVSPHNAANAAALLGVKLCEDFVCAGNESAIAIRGGEIDAAAGGASFESFVQAVDLAARGEAEAIVTLPINKASWSAAGLRYKGHTDYLRERFGGGLIMALGCPKRFVALYTDHIPLREVARHIAQEPLSEFLIRLWRFTRFEPIGVLGLNPHAGDRGAIGEEETIINAAIQTANERLKRPVFEGAIVPDAAFTPKAIERYPLIAAMYHDQGLAPLKALFFDESINITLGLPFKRTSVDHGTAFDIAYKNQNPSIASYLNAVSAAINDLWS